MPKKAIANVMANFTKSTGIGVKVNTVDHNTFQEQINSYLQGKPDDVFTWFAGYRMQFFAQKGLADPDRRRLEDADAADAAGDEGRLDRPRRAPVLRADLQLPVGGLLPQERLREQNGYTVPKTWDQFIALAKKMKADGLIPIAFTDKDGWPAMGTFDILNMRINGYQFHVDLMAGKDSWDSAAGQGRLQPVEGAPAVLLAGALGLTWQEGAQQLVNKQAGMFLLGSFVGQQFTKPADHRRPRLLPVPVDQPEVGAGLRSTRRSTASCSRRARRATRTRRSCSRYLGSAAAANTYLATDPNDIGGEQAREHGALQRAAEEGGEADRVGASTSRSTWTATRGPTSPPP